MFMHKHKDREHPNIINSTAFESVYRITSECRRQKLEENPRLMEFENIVRQCVNDYIVSQITAYHENDKVWIPSIESVYMCYAYIRNLPVFDTDKEFQVWYNRTDISEIRFIISHELNIYITYMKPCTGH